MTELKPKLMQIDGHKLVMQPLRVEGEGTPVVLIHGAVQSVSFFIPPLVPSFAGDRDAYALSLPGHYPAAFPPDFTDEQFTAEAYADWLVEALRQSFGGAPVILAGHSTGGFAALAMAARAPNLVRGLISVAGFAEGEPLGLMGMAQDLARGGAVQQFLFRAMFGISRLSPGMIRSAYRGWPGLVSDPRTFDAYPHVREFVQAIYPNMRALDLKGLALAFRPAFHITGWLPSITAPTLVITGTQDGVIAAEQSRLIAERVPNATLHMMEGLGHLPFIEEPVGFQAIISDWYAAHDL